MAALERFPVRIVSEADESIPDDGDAAKNAGPGAEDQSTDAEALMLTDPEFDAQEYVLRYARVLTEDALGSGLAAAHYEHFSRGLSQRSELQRIDTASPGSNPYRSVRDVAAELAALRSVLLGVLDRMAVTDAMLVRLTGILVDQEQHMQRLQRERTTWFKYIGSWFARRG